MKNSEIIELIEDLQKALSKALNNEVVREYEHLQVRAEVVVKNLTIPDVSNQRELLSCDNGCDWQLKGIQTNDYLECSRCKKRKAT